jgi:hypothetical protein
LGRLFTVFHCIPHRSLLSRVHFLLLLFLVPLLLSKLRAVLWVNRPQRYW